MSGGAESGGEKVHDPTPQKLAEARRRGDVARSMDMSAAAGFIGLFVACAAMGPKILEGTGGALGFFISEPDRLTGRILGPGGTEVLGPVLYAALSGILPILILPFAAACAALLAQRAFVFAPGKITPKLSRLSMIANAKQKFGPSGLMQFAKSTVKMGAIGAALVIYLTSRQDQLIGAVRGHGWMAAQLLAETLLSLLAITCVIYGAIGLLDILWQNYDHARKLRMSFQEMKDEAKQSDGDPHMRQQRRQRAQDLASNRMLVDVPKADVVIVNPTHFAVALRWSRQKGSAPVCVAKGVDNIAAKIREIAAENGVPIHRDAPTARAIHDVVDIGAEIAPEHYKAVAAALRFADALKERTRDRTWR